MEEENNYARCDWCDEPIDHETCEWYEGNHFCNQDCVDKWYDTTGEA